MRTRRRGRSKGLFCTNTWTAWIDFSLVGLLLLRYVQGEALWFYIPADGLRMECLGVKKTGM